MSSTCKKLAPKGVRIDNEDEFPVAARKYNLLKDETPEEVIQVFKRLQRLHTRI